jgi:hypothetical protein
MFTEDTSLREDKDRLEKCRSFIASLSAADIPGTIPEIWGFLHDRWSEVRSACAKALTKVKGAYNEYLCAELLRSCRESLFWQDVHGSLLGLSAMAAWADGKEHRNTLDDISLACLSLIGHLSIPVKDAARNCLTVIQQRVVDRSLLVDKIIDSAHCIVTAPNSDTEANTLTLDGLLGCLVDNYQLYPKLVPADGDGSTVQTMKYCALHPASTVRQKAGQVLTLFILTFQHEPSDALPVPPTVVTITTLLKEALHSPTAEHWCLQEISLMVAEELVRAVIDYYLALLSVLCSTKEARIEARPAANNSAFFSHLASFLTFLRDHLHLLLAHEQYEVRRMAVQLTPQLARAFVLLSVNDDSDNGGSAVDFALHFTPADEKLDTNTEMLEADAGHGLLRESLSSSGEDVEDNSCARLCQVSQDSGDAAPGALGAASSEQRSTGGRTRPSSLQVVLNSSFRAPSGEVVSSSAAGMLDLPLIVQMVWLCELIKENQHFFEAFVLSDEWKSSSVTKDLQLRSVKESAAEASRRYWSESPARSPVRGACAAGEGCTRNAVDHWSLDVRGRLQEIEKRTQFHRTVKSLVAASVDVGSSAAVALLVRNCTAILTLIEVVIQKWETLFGSPCAATFTSTLATYHSVWGHAPTVLSVDFIECLALMDSFLLSVEHRFTQCPDIRCCSCPELDEVEFMMSSAETLRRGLAGVKVRWLRQLAQIQCVSRCSTHVSNRSGISGHSTTRQTASEFLLLLHGQGESRVRAHRDLFTSSLGADAESRSRVSQHHPVREALARVLANAKRAASQADSRNSAVAEIYTEMMAEPVVLTTSLTNAAVDIAQFSHLDKHTNSSTTAADLAYLQTPAHVLSHPIGGTPQSSTKIVYTPSAFTFHSPGGAASNPHAHAASATSGASLVHRYQAMDQWSCESVSPLLTCLAGGVLSTIEAVDLAAVVVEWVASCVLHPLWLDCRHNARKYLFEALALLLARAESSVSSHELHSGDQAGGGEGSLRSLLLLRIVRAVAEVLVLRAAKPLLDLKSVICLVRAATAAAKLFTHYWSELRSYLEETDAEGENMQDLLRYDLQPLAAECAERLQTGTAYYRAAYPAITPPSHAELLRRQLSAQAKKEPSSPSRKSRSSDSPSNFDAELAIPLGGGAGTAEEGEFSDWDDDSDTDEEQLHLTDVDAAAATTNLASMLEEEATQLCGLVENLLE